MTACWVVGAGGLIGSAVARASGSSAPRESVPWHDRRAAAEVLAARARGFRDACGDQPWGIVWAAGAITVASDEERARREVEAFEACLASVARNLPSGPGSVVLVSSAGGLHAGSEHPPFDSTTAPAPISPYGRAKLAQERCAASVLEGAAPLVIARVSNAYGPGQDLGKTQGIVSRLARSAVLREPANVFVPLSTVRDYVYADDAGRSLLAWADCARDDPEPVRTVVVASGTGTSIAQLIRTVNDIAHRKVPIALGTHPSAAYQPPDLRFTPTVLPEGARLRPTPLPVGVRHVVDDIRARMQRGRALAR